jgi:hypothetical protein
MAPTWSHADQLGASGRPSPTALLLVGAGLILIGVLRYRGLGVRASFVDQILARYRTTQAGVIERLEVKRRIARRDGRIFIGFGALCLLGALLAVV